MYGGDLIIITKCQVGFVFEKLHIDIHPIIHFVGYLDAVLIDGRRDTDCVDLECMREICVRKKIFHLLCIPLI